MKKICFFSGDITRGGGTEKTSITIANKLHQQGCYKILFLSLVEQNSEPFFPLDPHIARHTLGNHWVTPGPGYLKFLPRLHRFLRREQVDVLIDIDIVLDVLSLPVSRHLNTKVISWDHFNFDFEMSVLYRRLILQYSARRSNYCITLTDQDRQFYEKRLGRLTRIQVVHNPIPETTELSFEDGDSPIAALSEKMIVTVAGLVPCKGMDYLGEVAVQVLTKHPDWKWYVLGEGEERSLLERVITENHLEGRLILTGQIADVSSYLRRARIFVLTSRREGLPMCLLEARSFSLPCICFRLSGTVEIIADDINGYLIQPYDRAEMSRKLEKLMTDDSLRKQLALGTPPNIETFQMEYILQQWNEILEQLCR